MDGLSPLRLRQSSHVRWGFMLHSAGLNRPMSNGPLLLHPTHSLRQVLTEGADQRYVTIGVKGCQGSVAMKRVDETGL